MLIKYKDLTDAQKTHLKEVFYYGREPTKEEMAYSYFFNESGVCEYAE